MLAGVAFVVYAFALRAGASSVVSVRPRCVGAFLAAFVWLAYQYDREGHR